MTIINRFGIKNFSDFMLYSTELVYGDSFYLLVKSNQVKELMRSNDVDVQPLKKQLTNYNPISKMPVLVTFKLRNF